MQQAASVSSGRRRWGRAKAVVVCCTVAIAMVGCSAQAPQRADGRAAFVIGAASEPDTLNPILGYGSDGASLIFDGLLERDATNRLIPALAQSLPQVSADGRTVTVRLRSGVRFHDGSSLTAQDVVFTYSAVLNPQVDSTMRSDLEMLSGVSSPGPGLVVFSLKYRYAPFLQRLTLGIVPATAFAGRDVNKAPFNTAPIGTGPYRVQAWTPGDKLVLVANPAYWDGVPKSRRVVVAFITDENARAERVRSGEIDAAELPPRLAMTFAADPDVRVQKVPTADYRGVMLPLKSRVTGDLAVRRALTLGVDRQAMITGILNGAGTAAFTPIAGDSAFADPKAQGNPKGDLSAARALLSAAGWLPGPGGIRVKKGTRAAFTLMYPAGDSLRKELALAVTADAKRLGIAVTAQGLTWDAIEPRMKSDALVMGWGSPYDPDFINYKLFTSGFAEKGFFNPGSYRSATTDRALRTGRDSVDPAVRKAAYRTFQEQLTADVPWVFLAFLQHTYVVKASVEGVRPRPEAHEHGVANGLWWNLPRWSRR